jgi:hypothetical protein
MKTLVIALSFLISGSAFACPQISGNYTCQTQDGPQITVIQQSTAVDGDIFDIDGYQFKADGVAYPENSEEFTGTIATACTANAVDITIIGDVIENGTKIGSTNLTQSMYMENGSLIQDLNGVFEYEGQAIPIAEKILCTPN